MFVRGRSVLRCHFAVSVSRRRVLFGLCHLVMRVKVRGLQVVVRCCRMVRGRLMVMLNSGVGWFGGHEKFLLKITIRFRIKNRRVHTFESTT